MEKKCIITKLNIIKNEISRAFSEEEIKPLGINVGSIIEDIEKEIKEKDIIIENEKSSNVLLNNILKQNEKYFETIYNNIEAVIFVIDVTVNGKFIYAGVNPAYEKATGTSEKDINGKSSEELFSKELAEYFNSNYERCIENQNMIDYEESIVIKGKNTFWHTKLIPIKDEFNIVNRIIGTSHDITAIKRAENKAKENEEFISTLIDTIPNPVFYKNKEMKYMGCNIAFEKLVGLERDEIYGKVCIDIFSKEVMDLTECKDKEIIKNGKKLKYELKMKNKKGDWKDFLVNKAPYFDNNGDFKGVVGVISDITELKQMQEILQGLSINDELTGVLNKRGIRELGDKSFREAQREKSLLSVIMIDIDYFKRYNDYYGHQAGDRCLIAVADTIKESCKRPLDVVGRYGGEEFIVILSDTDKEGSNTVADRIRKKIFDLKIGHEESITEKYISVSIGVYTATPNEEDKMENFIEIADEKLYQAKRYGRNRVEK